VSGKGDWHTPDDGNAGYYAEHIAGSEWHSMPDVGHYTFKPICHAWGKVRTRKICNDAWGVDRAAVHAQVLDWTRAFLRKAMP
ncbi:MAG TPA: hypothetical protein VFH51_04140, partial [Myxococcota bacterium]|nr:hypothetical protein [Myxococcota bacterium]